jgi:5-methylthioadenosine/S-adenosylhomocysteine deaminase
MTKYYLDGLTVVTMDENNTIINNAVIITHNEHILFVGSKEDAPIADNDDIVIDCKGKVGIPGLVNNHTHLAMTLFRGAADDLPLMTWLQEKIWPIEANMSTDDIYNASMLGIAEMISHGVTTFTDMYWHTETVAKAVKNSGIRATLSGVVIGVSPDAEKIWSSSRDFVKAAISENHPRIKCMYGPHAPYTVLPDFMERVIDAAIEDNVGIHTHLSETEFEVLESIKNFGKRPIVLMNEIGLFKVPVIAAHVVHPDSEEIKILSENNVSVAHCPSSNMKLASGIAPISKMTTAGINITLGTDGAGSNNRLDVLNEARMAALLAKVGGDATAVPATQALRMGTVNGAIASGWVNAGTITPGALADITIFDFNKPHLRPDGCRHISHLIYSATGQDADTVLIHGKIVYQDSKFVNMDLVEIYSKVEESAHRLFK